MAAVPAPRFENVNLLRAFAALAVLVYHVIELTQWSSYPAQGPLATFRIGWLGVDLFFVVSGFVIAYSALALYRAAPAEFAGRYWSRRLTRIAPLYFLTLTLWVVAFWPQYAAWDARDWGAQVASHLTFTHSFWSRTHGAINGPSWSLAIEMQFYLAVALAIGWIHRAPGWKIWAWCIAIAWLYRAGIFYAYSGRPAADLFVKVTQLPGTLDEFGAGIFLAKWVLERPDGGSRKGLAWLGLAAVLGWAAMALFWPRAQYWNHAGMVIFWRTALAVFLMCAVGSAVYLAQSLARRWLRPLDYLGEVSYGIYLWHFFAVTWAIQWVGKDSPRVLAIAMVLTIAMAAASWHLLEKPFMRLARR